MPVFCEFNEICTNRVPLDVPHEGQQVAVRLNRLQSWSLQGTDILNVEAEIVHRFVVDSALMRVGHLWLTLFIGSALVVRRGLEDSSSLVVHWVEDPSLARRAKVMESL